MARTMSRQSERREDYSESCINDQKVLEAKTDRFKPRHVSLVNFKKQPPRDDSMFKIGDRWMNVQLENTREEREKQSKKHKANKSQLPSSFRR